MYMLDTGVPYIHYTSVDVCVDSATNMAESSAWAHIMAYCVMVEKSLNSFVSRSKPTKIKI